MQRELSFPSATRISDLGQEATLTTGGFLALRGDIQHCPNCNGELKIIAAILEAPVIERILTQLGLQARASPRAPAREHMQQAA